MNRQTLRLRHRSGETRIDVGSGLLAGSGEWLSSWLDGRISFLIASRKLYELYGDRVEQLAGAAGALRWIEIPDGEPAKSVAVAAAVWTELLDQGGKRDSRLITLGGGATGDLGGFAAATFLRGVEYVQLPTTLLAMVDASLGGKTGIDLPAAKNCVGAFHHPHAVVADVEVLATLPAADLRAGAVEMIKMAALLDVELFEQLESSLDRLLALEPEPAVEMIAAAMRAKLGVVERDERESGERKLLNFGHTLAHAIETECGYENLRHGEAVAFGVSFALRLAEIRGLDGQVAARIRSLLQRLDPPALPTLDVGRLIRVMGRDKKAREGGLGWVLPRALGEGYVCDDVSWAEVESQLELFLAAPWEPLD